MSKKNGIGKVIWITGLSGAGKTTLAKELQKHLKGSILLDGDELRTAFKELIDGYDRESRIRLARTYARTAQLLVSQGHTVIVSTISLFHEIHKWNRENISKYFEIFLDISDEERFSRKPSCISSVQKCRKDNNLNILAAEMPLFPNITFKGDISLNSMVSIILEMVKNGLS